MIERIDQYYDPMTHTWTHTGVQGDRMIVHTSADIEPVIERATKLRNAEGYWAGGVKAGFAHVADVPPTVQVELRGIGVDIYTASAREIVAGIRKLNKEYLLTTTKRV